MRPRLIDVAEAAGVSMKTVSNVVNGSEHVREATRLRVLAAIDKLGYRPNIAARNLAQGRSGVIAFAVPQLDRPYFASLAARMLDEAETFGWIVQFHQTGGRREAELGLLTDRHPARLDGIIMSPLSLSPEDVQRRDPALPLVLLGEKAGEDHLADHVGIDNREAGRAATDHLLGLGRRRVMALAPGPGVADDRINGYRDALVAAGIGVDEDIVLPAGGVRGEDAELTLGRWLDAGHPAPDAIFAGTDWLAMGAIRALVLRGLKVPQQVAVVGFDDIPYDLATLPTLTTVAPDRVAIARLSLQALRDQQPGQDPVRLQAPFTLVVRESTAGIGPGH
ncbi:LacI family DNA-binding transcriptional regulator [Kribbella sp. NPDC049227]|uniref:LacI family DNA-binding transcriptional regulator n=1 Tax=Kribbella sp. NPDC049227 TaxID=3364113 RepID=UPI00371ADF09